LVPLAVRWTHRWRATQSSSKKLRAQLRPRTKEHPQLTGTTTKLAKLRIRTKGATQRLITKAGWSRERPLRSRALRLTALACTGQAWTAKAKASMHNSTMPLRMRWEILRMWRQLPFLPGS
jgi:hypothetical protein